MNTIKYDTDVSDEEWAIIEPMIPPPLDNRPRLVDIRQVWNAIQFRNRNGTRWIATPRDFPPYSTVYYYFRWWRRIGLFEQIHQALAALVRVVSSRDPEPSVAHVDSQTVKTTPEAGQPCGFDPARKITGNGRKRHIVVDSLGLVLEADVTSAAVADATAAKKILSDDPRPLSPAPHDIRR
jgi:putative transposase